MKPKRYKLKFDLPWFDLKAGDVFEAENFDDSLADEELNYVKVNSGLRYHDFKANFQNPSRYPDLFEEIVELTNKQKWEHVFVLSGIFDSILEMPINSRWTIREKIDSLVYALDINGYDAERIYQKMVDNVQNWNEIRTKTRI